MLMSVYLARYDLKTAPLNLQTTPTAEQLLLAPDFDTACEIARSIQNDLRPGMVHKECVVRDVVLKLEAVHVDRARLQRGDATS